MKRRSSFTDQSVTYGAIGATLAPDLLRYPPSGVRPAEDSVKIGAGRARFDTAAAELMTWASRTTPRARPSPARSRTPSSASPPTAPRTSPRA